MARLLFSKVPFVLALGATWQETWQETWQGLRHRVAHPYHPERHYMRGPGPKAQAKGRQA